MTQFAPPNLPAVFTAGGNNLREFDKQLISELSEMVHGLQAILDGGISLGDNVDANVVSFTSSATPDTEEAIAHGLGKVPQHFIVSGVNKAAVVYRGPTSFTASHVYVKTSLASVAVKLILL